MKNLFVFPNPVNETSSRLVAGGAVLMGLAFAVTGNAWILFPLTYGFIARVLTGPTLSPLGRIATQLITPRIQRNHLMVAGAPKRFAQGIGAVFTATASVLWILDVHSASRIVVSALVVAASCEAFLGYCVGCAIFGQLMKMGIIPESVCVECNDITSRLSASRQ